MPSLPDELWHEIMSQADTFPAVPAGYSTPPHDNESFIASNVCREVTFECSEQWRNVLATRLQTILVCRVWHRVGLEFLYSSFMACPSSWEEFPKEYARAQRFRRQLLDTPALTLYVKQLVFSVPPYLQQYPYARMGTVSAPSKAEFGDLVYSFNDICPNIRIWMSSRWLEGSFRKGHDGMSTISGGFSAGRLSLTMLQISMEWMDDDMLCNLLLSLTSFTNLRTLTLFGVHPPSSKVPCNVTDTPLCLPHLDSVAIHFNARTTSRLPLNPSDEDVRFSQLLCAWDLPALQSLSVSSPSNDSTSQTCAVNFISHHIQRVRAAEVAVSLLRPVMDLSRVQFLTIHLTSMGGRELITASQGLFPNLEVLLIRIDYAVLVISGLDNLLRAMVERRHTPKLSKLLLGSGLIKQGDPYILRAVLAPWVRMFERRGVDVLVAGEGVLEPASQALGRMSDGPGLANGLLYAGN